MKAIIHTIISAIICFTIICVLHVKGILTGEPRDHYGLIAMFIAVIAFIRGPND